MQIHVTGLKIIAKNFLDKGNRSGRLSEVVGASASIE